jgi:hypothetical protein
MTPLIKKRLVWFAGAVAAIFLLGFGSSIGGWGPCGPGSLVGLSCLLGVPVALLFAIIMFALLVGAFIREKKKKKGSPALPSSPQ